MNENQTTSSKTTEETVCSQNTAAPSKDKHAVSTEKTETLRCDTEIKDDEAFCRDVEHKLTQCLLSDDASPITDPPDIPQDTNTGDDAHAIPDTEVGDGTIAFPAFPERTEEAAAAAIYSALQANTTDTDAPEASAHPLFEDVDSAEYSDDSTDDTTSDAETAPAAKTEAVTDTTKGKKRRWPLVLLLCVLLAVIGYTFVIFVPSGPIAGLRDMYIQTAMSTADHQWLATAIFPQWVIDRAWKDPNVRPDNPDEIIEGLETVGTGADTEPADTADIPDPPTTTTDAVTEPSQTETTAPVVQQTPSTENDILGLATLKVGDTDYAGNKVSVVDVEEGLFISEFSGKNHLVSIFKHHGYVMVIDDPSRVFIGSTPEKDETGYRILDMMDYYGDVVAGINASGFADPNDQGTGNDIIGACMSEGELWGQFSDTMESVVLTEENQLKVGWLPNWSNYTNIRDGMQFGPSLVRNGKNIIDKENGGGWGTQPRTAIGQREDGAIIMIVIDGRVSSSDGCTLWEMADMMVRYGAVTAGGCDGGSSVVMAYDGEVLNDNSSKNPEYGRRIPNAFLVRSKKADD